MKIKQPTGNTQITPIVTSVMLTAAAKPTAAGCYIFAVIPTDGLPAGIVLNDIARLVGTNWTLVKKYADAETVLVANDALGLVQVTWRKFNGTWMSTADEYIPDGKEYQTGKLWDGKPVFRKCTASTFGATNTNADSGVAVPLTGTVIICMGTVTRIGQRVTLTYSGDAAIYVSPTTGHIMAWCATGSLGFASSAYVGWAEYTKS